MTNELIPWSEALDKAAVRLGFYTGAKDVPKRLVELLKTIAHDIRGTSKEKT